MKKKKVSTRQLLLETAGELFAENGMKGTSIKMIAEKSKQNIAAANYHFGSKKNLYIETLKFVVDKLGDGTDLKSGKIPAKSFNSELEKFVKARCKMLLSRSTPTWYGGLIVRAVQESSKEVLELALEYFTPDIEYLERLAKAGKPKIKPTAAKLWAYTVTSQIIYYVFSRKTILMVQKRKTYSKDFIDEVSDHIIKVCKLAIKAC
jgi:AcrR family transcriptional regulator